MIRQAFTFAQGIGIALGGQVEDSVWQAVADTKAESNLMKWQHRVATSSNKTTGSNF